MKPTTNQLILGIVLVVALIIVVPKLFNFSILQNDQCQYTDDGKFITNVNQGNILNYDAVSQAWVSVNGVAYGNVQRVESQNVCQYKQVLGTTPDGYQIVSYADNQVAICYGNIAEIFDKNMIISGSKTRLDQCSNYEILCPTNYDPYCGEVQTNTGLVNQTFFNQCQLERDDARFLYQGQCTNSNVNNYTQTNCTTIIGGWSNCTNGTEFRTISVTGNCQNTLPLTRVCNSTSSVCDTGYTLTNGQCVLSTEKPNFLMNELFVINGFSIKLWMLLAIVLLILILWIFKGK